MNLGSLSLHELALMLRLGFIVEQGRTLDGRVTSYALSPVGRALLNNRAATEHLSDEVASLRSRSLTGEVSGAKVRA